MLTKFNLYQPAAIDNSLNSYQIIHKIIAKMNDVIDEINNIDSKANEYTDEQIRLLKIELQSKFDDIESEIVLLNGRIDLTNSNLTTLENAFNDFRVAITNSVNQLTINVANLSDYVAQTESMLIDYIDTKIDVLTQLIESLQGLKVHGYDGKLMTVQQALDSIINNMNLKSERISFGFITKKVFSENEYITGSGLNLRVGDLTYKELIDGLNATSMSTSLYLTLQYSNSVTATSLLYPNFKEIIKKQLETTVFIFAITIAKHQNNTSYYNYTAAVCSKLYVLGLGYGTNNVDVSSRYGDYYN